MGGRVAEERPTDVGGGYWERGEEELDSGTMLESVPCWRVKP